MIYCYTKTSVYVFINTGEPTQTWYTTFKDDIALALIVFIECAGEHFLPLELDSLRIT